VIQYTNELTPSQIETIRTAAQLVFGYIVRITLFGSRVDDHAKGGDIDLMVKAIKLETAIEKIKGIAIGHRQRRSITRPPNTRCNWIANHG